ncbi:hypothetical protein EV182_001719 [Spiromyces aspiralis]|uniref:Uncharacterized protein n=1 Tax=Spiromyces aspiralis TaxID=68401 RepID=A0ACC1HF70_9FUNG|nr:hypothetical protein EV182_001719 [Spiromyces aspiralis]
MVESDVELALIRYLDERFHDIKSLSRASQLRDSEAVSRARLDEELWKAKLVMQDITRESREAANSGSKELASLREWRERMLNRDKDAVDGWDASERELVSTLAEKLAQLRVLQRACDYLSVVHQVEVQSELCVDKSKGRDVTAAVQGFQKLIDTVKGPAGSWSNSSDQAARGAVQGQAASSLCRFLESKLQCTWKGIEAPVMGRTASTLDSLGWPKEISSLTPAQRSALKDVVNESMALQSARDSFGPLLPGLELHHASISNLMLLAEGRPPVALPIAYIVDTLLHRFRFHFEGTKKTNQPANPEWWISHLLGYMQRQVPFIETTVQSLLDTYELSDLDHGTSYIDARNEFIRSLLVAVRHKLKLDRPYYTDHPLVMAKVARELSQFDDTIRSMYFYTDSPRPGTEDADTAWKGCLGEWIEDRDLIDRWIESEGSRARDEYTDLIRDEDAFEPAYDVEDMLLSADSARPTKSSQRLINIMDGILERIQPLNDTRLAMSFILVTVIPLLRDYLEDLEMELDEFKRVSLAFLKDSTAAIASTTSTLLNLASPVGAPGIGTHTAALLGQVQRLSAWFHSALHVETTLKDWNDLTFFVLIWASFCSWRRRQQHLSPLRAFDLDSGELSEWSAAAASSPCSGDSEEGGSEEKEEEEDDDDKDDDVTFNSGGLFDFVWTKYAGVSRRVIETTIHTISKEFKSWLRPYHRKNDWALSISGFGDGNADVSDIEPGPGMPQPDVASQGSQYRILSPELVQPLAEISQTLHAVATTLFPQLQAEEIILSLAADLDRFLSGSVAMGHKFDEAGGVQFRRDMCAVFSEFGTVTTQHLGFGWRTQDHFPRTLACAQILSLPTDVERIAHESHAFDGGVEAPAAVVTLDALERVVKDALEDPAEFDTVLCTKLGIPDGSLSPSDINYLLRNRVDA